MKYINWAVLGVVFLAGCSQNKTATSKSTFQNKIILGEFFDTATNSTFNERTLGNIPASVNLKKDMSEVKNQSDRGTCSFFSAMALTEATIKKEMGVEVNLSEEYLNFSTKNNGYFSNSEGSSSDFNLSSMKYSGALLERDWGYQPTWFAKGLPCAKYKNTDLYAPVICFSHNKPDSETMEKIIDMNSISTIRIARNTNEVIKFIANNKRPVIVTLPVNFNAWSDSGEVFHNEEMRRQCLNKTAECGMHEVLVYGYDLKKKVFYFKNSWGKTWGEEGFGVMPIDTVDRYAGSDFLSLKLNAKLNIPADYAENRFNFQDVNFSAETQADGSINIKAEGELKGIRGHMVYVSSFLGSHNNEINVEPSAENVSMIQLASDEQLKLEDTFVRALKYIVPEDGLDELSWTKGNSLILNISKDLLGTNQAKELLETNKERAVLRSTLYIHNDTDAFLVLKRNFHKIN